MSFYARVFSPATICDQVRRADRGGKVAFTYGSGEPVLRLVSANGPVVINSTDRLPAEKDLRAELEAKSKADRQAAIRMNELAGRIHSEADARELTDAIAKFGTPCYRSGSLSASAIELLMPSMKPLSIRGG